MLQQLRNNTKVILWFVVVAFVVTIFAAWGMNLRSDGEDRARTEQDIVGTVDGIDITRRAYSDKFQELYAQLRAQRGENFELGATESNMLLDQAWEATIQQIILDREMKRMGITVTDNELVSFLRRNPHPQLQQMFVDDQGQFDYQAYLAALSDPSIDWTELERWGRSRLPEIKLETLLISQVHVPERDIMERFKEQTIEVTARYAMVPFEVEDPPYEPTDEELAAEYAGSADDYRESEKRKVRFIEIEKTPTTLDEQDVYSELIDIRNEILEGADFSEMARTSSDDYMTAQRGGNLGFFERGMMDSIFTEAAFALDTARVSMPVRTPFGYHLIRVNDRKVEDGVEMVDASHILLKVEPGYETIDSLSTLIRDLNGRIEDEGFEKAAEDKGLETIDSEPFMKGSFIREIGYLPRAVNFAFNHKPGTISSPMETETSIYYIKVLEVIPEKVQGLEDVSSRIVEKIRKQRREEKAEGKALELRQKVLTGADFEEAAHSLQLEIVETAPFKLEDSVPGIGTGTNFAVACHKLPVKEISVPIKGSGGWYVIIVTSRSGPDLNEFSDQRPEIMTELQRERASRFMAKWYEGLRDNAKVVDERETTLN